jgi:hypothetical protein
VVDQHDPIVVSEYLSVTFKTGQNFLYNLHIEACLEAYALETYLVDATNVIKWVGEEVEKQQLLIWR